MRAGVSMQADSCVADRVAARDAEGGGAGRLTAARADAGRAARQALAMRRDGPQAAPYQPAVRCGLQSAEYSACSPLTCRTSVALQISLESTLSSSVASG